MSFAPTMPSVNEARTTTRTIAPLKPDYNISIGYLRAFITLLVVAHHAALAYAPFSPPVAASFVAPPRWWQAFPIVDSNKWSGAATIVGFNDTFFMSLMFLISGLFVWSSLQRKTARGFLRTRMLRLGLPFLAAAAVVAPIAYYPTYLQIGQHGAGGFIKQWLSIGVWPAGPAWFVWLLLAFDLVAVELFSLKPSWAEAAGCFFAHFSNKPFRFFVYLVGISAAVYIPLAMKFNPLSWTQFGPFAFQTSRLVHYLVYFLVGVAIGAYGIERGILGAGGKLARRWLLWAIGAVLVFLLSSAVFIMIVTSARATSPWWQAIADFLFTITCATTSVAMLAGFVRWVKKSRPIFDSLSRNAYGIYLVHYALISWLQYAMLGSHLPGFAKLAIVFSLGATLSWLTTAWLRRIPAVARFI